MPAYALVAAWLVFYQVLAAGALARTPIAVLPTAWVAWILWRRLLVLPSPWMRAAWWLGASAGIGYVASGFSGLRIWLGWSPEAAQILLGTVLAAAGVAAFWRVGRTTRAAPTFNVVFWGALASAGITTAAAAVKDAGFTIEWTRFVFSDSAGTLLLFWLWAAGTFAAESLKLTDWTVRRAAASLPAHAARWVLPAVVVVASLFEWLATEPSASTRAGAIGAYVRQVADSWGAVALLPLWWHMFAGVLGTLITAALLLFRRLTPRAARDMFAAWLVSLLVLQGLLAAGRELVDAYDSRRLGIGLAALATVAIGLLLELSKSKRGWESEPASAVRVRVAFLATAIASAIVLSTSPGGDWTTRQALIAFAGMVHLGVPIMIYHGFEGRLHVRERLGSRDQVTAFAAGYATALIILAWNPTRSAWLVVALPVGLVVLGVFRWRRRSTPASGGMMAGALIGSGVVAGWMMPYPPTIPFVRVQRWIDVLRNWGSSGRAPLTSLHFGLLIAAWTIGAGAGYLVFWRSRARSAD